jgi:hypothetical protein
VRAYRVMLGGMIVPRASGLRIALPSRGAWVEGGARAALLAAMALGCGGRSEHRDVAPTAATTPAEPAAADAAVTPASAAPGTLPEAALQHISAKRLRAHVEVLAHDRLRGRPTPSPELDEAAKYLGGQLRELGLVAPELAPGYEQRFECGGERKPGLASNVIGLLPGRDAELAKQAVMVSAHYDHIGERGTEGDIIFNGANDDASGTAAVLTIAEALAAAPPRRSVLFVAFCGEELGLLGSSHYAEHPVFPLADVVADINLEMLGRAGPADPPVAWMPGSTRSELITWLAAANPGASAVPFVDAFAIGPEEGEAFNRADNYPLALAGVVAHTVSAGSIDELYHSRDDEADTIDYEHMTMLVRAVARGVYRLAELEGRPAWSDPPF